MSGPLFDDYADEYDKALARGISFSGESRTYFALKRVEKTAELLRDADGVERVLDFGCGTGDTLPLLAEHLNARFGVGVDISPRSIERARLHVPDERLRYEVMADCPAVAVFDVAYCNGVFHHIPPAERHGAACYVFDRLRPGGFFAYWENNPWNPGTRLAMKRTPFDRDAITLTPPESRALLESAGFIIKHEVSMFLFPRVLGFLRFLEPWLLQWPIGAQYLVLGQKL
ncbi:MAG TPA: methyltransferase domain-containing protein [Kiritimatiellia bacterium]|nr:methyltransferase domain-containing protein [Kiritimatiellia bacterium]HMO98705.1 methyltransferase domain-containing protein [Kiritimatiellia bacterium]HMP90892.1 methyltransferase domain-containing protein [Kiritimatiellia bacterium]